MGLVEIPINQVRLGMFIRLEISWFKHPFLRSSFMLTHPKEVEILLGLGLDSVKYDPKKSMNQETAVSGEEKILAAKPVPESPDSPPSDLDGSQDAYDIYLQFITERKQRRIHFLNIRRKNLVKQEQEYRLALSQVAGVMKDIEAGKGKGLEAAEQLMDHVVEVMLQDPETIVHLMNLSEKDNVTYFHSLNVSILSLIVGRKLGLSRSELHELGLGGVLHDIGKLKIPKRVWLKKTPLTKAEEKFLHLHPQYGVSLISSFSNATKEVLDIVFQHHERCNGKGYPQGLTDDQISCFAKITAIADVYDNLTNRGLEDRFFTPHESLSFIYTRYKDELSREVTLTFIKCLGVYPPGTVVELSDGSVGMVITTDQAKTMHPTLIIYDESFPRTEPLIVSLAEEDSLRIVSSLRPDQISAEAMDYLQPGKMVGFFVGSLTSPLKTS